MGEINVPQPGGAYAWIRVDGELLNDPKKGQCNLLNFSYSRSSRGGGGSGNKAEFGLIDPEWDKLESKLAGAEELSVQYGWVSGSISDPIYLVAAQYKIEMRHDFVIIRISATSVDPMFSKKAAAHAAGETTYDKVVQQSAFFMDGKKEGKSPSEIIKDRLQKAGFDVSQIEDTQPFAKRHVDRNGTLAITPHTIVPNQSPFRHIYDFLQPRSVSANTKKPASAGEIQGETAAHGEAPAGGYLFAIRDTKPPQAVFRPYWKEGKVVENFQFPGRYGKGLEKVVSFEPNVDLRLLTSSLGLAGQQQTFVDFTSGERAALEAAPEKFEVETPNGKITLERKYFQGPNAAPNKFMDLADPNVPSSLQRLSAFYGLASSKQFTAKLVIIGDPKFEIFDWISMDVNKPNGEPHYTSGKYMVNEVIDTIDAGMYTTTLSLKKIVTDDMKKARTEVQTMTDKVDAAVKAGVKAGDKNFNVDQTLKDRNK
jgi:hypothetical protein